MENNFQYISAAITDRGLSEKRLQNEDSYLEINKTGLFAVADGVGGAQAGDVASSMAMEILGEAFVNMHSSGDAEDVMRIGIEKANSAIFQMSQDLAQLATMATTIVALHLSGNIATIGHVGDSRLYRVDASGNLFRETQDHSVVEEEVRAGRMTPEQAENHPSKNVISRALGAEPIVEIDMKTIMVEPNNTFLICSDGITRHISDNEIRELLSSNLPPSEICEQMKFVCYERGAEDNLTAVIVKISAEISGNNIVYNNNFELEIDEPTVAASRPPLVNTAIFSQQLADESDEIPTQNLRMTDQMQSHSEAQSTAFEPEIAQNETLPPSAEVISQRKTVETVEQRNFTENQPTENVISARSATREEIDLYKTAAPSNGGFLSTLFSSLLLLIVGAIVGAGLHYFFSQSAAAPQPAPQITQTQTDVISYKAFEDNRRNVDQNPQGFINANNAKIPQTAEDLYLLGRSYMLTKQYVEARNTFLEAKNKLGQTDAMNGKILANEIAMALAIINTPTALTSFEQDATANNPTANANSANVNR